ncbi:hypothetical protein FA15DRAFT_722806 [Coprinopsis marcescibilis]|uniref:Uncharacterized protein n=1 Tax=Coprinopsis marcescibilis TaxID=230819 RepID=A0A5C3KIJ3_COPMA|nr:hypothetical protein FA15DRAFT_722806 [Coprinopsis marcescibilis]
MSYPVWFIVDDSDSSIIYNGDWTIEKGSFGDRNIGGKVYQGSQHAATGNAGLSFTFRGTGISIRGTWKVHSEPFLVKCTLDKVEIDRFKPWNPSLDTNWITLCAHHGATPGLHTLDVSVLRAPETFLVDSIAYLSGNETDQSYAPSKSLIFSASDAVSLFYGPGIGWGRGVGRDRGDIWAETSGAGCIVQFNGTRISWYGSLYRNFSSNPAMGTYSINGQPPIAFNISGFLAADERPSEWGPAAYKEFNHMFFQTPELASGSHVMEVIYHGSLREAPLVLNHLLIENDSPPPRESMPVAAIAGGVVGGARIHWYSYLHRVLPLHPQKTKPDSPSNFRQSEERERLSGVIPGHFGRLVNSHRFPFGRPTPYSRALQQPLLIPYTPFDRAPARFDVDSSLSQFTRAELSVMSLHTESPTVYQCFQRERVRDKRYSVLLSWFLSASDKHTAGKARCEPIWPDLKPRGDVNRTLLPFSEDEDIGAFDDAITTMRTATEASPVGTTYYWSSIQGQSRVQARRSRGGRCVYCPASPQPPASNIASIISTKPLTYTSREQFHLLFDATLPPRFNTPSQKNDIPVSVQDKDYATTRRSLLRWRAQPLRSGFFLHDGVVREDTPATATATGWLGCLARRAARRWAEAKGYLFQSRRTALSILGGTFSI